MHRPFDVVAVVARETAARHRDYLCATVVKRTSTFTLDRVNGVIRGLDVAARGPLKT